eukprot:589965-Rhodomonas_salina.1
MQNAMAVRLGPETPLISQRVALAGQRASPARCDSRGVYRRENPSEVPGEHAAKSNAFCGPCSTLCIGSVGAFFFFFAAAAAPSNLTCDSEASLPSDVVLVSDLDELVPENFHPPPSTRPEIS